MLCHALCAAAIGLQIAAVATPEWSQLSMGMGGIKVKAYMGLWKGCVDGNSQKICENIPGSTDPNYFKNSLQVCRVFSILSLVFLGICVLNMASVAAGLSYPKPKLCMSMLYLSLICSIVVLSVWPAEMLKDKATGQKLKLGYSYYLFLGGSLAVLLAVLNKHYSMGHLNI